MIRTPRAAGLVLCKRLGVDTASGEVSLIGMVNSLRLAIWPGPSMPLTCYAALQGGSGVGRMELTVTRLETEEDVMILTRSFPWPAGILTVHLELPVRAGIFPAPGRYLATLSFDGERAAQRLIELEQERKQP